jgi:hypothetical protein
MKTSLHIALVSAFVGSLAACGPSLTLDGQQVKVAESAAKTCRPISTIVGEGSSREKAEVDLRNRAAEIHANTVVVTEHADAGGKVKLTGQAFGCHADEDLGAAKIMPAPVPEPVPGAGAPVVPTVQ